MPSNKKGDKKLPDNIVNPFSDAFLEYWDLWKQYKKEQHRFTYKGVISEQAALMQLSTLSGSDESIAVEIIKQSICAGWKGLFMLKNQNKNGQSVTETRKGVADVLSRRNY